jgi:hypothetical protein
MAIPGFGREMIKSMRRRGQLALAFGGRDASARSWFLPIDAVALLLSAALAEVYGATMAAQLVRVFGDVVLNVVAEADDNPAIDALFAVTDFVAPDGRRAHLACGAREGDAVTAIAAQVARSPAAAGFVTERITMINVSHLIRTVRINAARIGVDLVAPFMPAPASAEFQHLMEPFTTLPAGIIEARSCRQRELAARRVGAQARARAMGGRVATGHRKQPLMQAA